MYGCSLVLINRASWSRTMSFTSAIVSLWCTCSEACASRQRLTSTFIVIHLFELCRSVNKKRENASFEFVLCFLFIKIEYALAVCV